MKFKIGVICAMLLSCIGCKTITAGSNASKKIVLIGDSTVKIERDNLRGWGQELSYSGKEIINYAKPGASAKSFYSQQWKNVKYNTGDLAIIQFGHNDVENEKSFKSDLQKFIKDIKDKGATPIVCSMVPRSSWKNGKIVRSKTFAVWAKEIALLNKIRFVDLNNLVSNHYNDKGEKYVNKTYFNAGDRTHTNRTGAKIIANIVKTHL